MLSDRRKTGTRRREERDSYLGGRPACLSASISDGVDGIQRPGSIRGLIGALRERGYTKPIWVRSGYEGLLEWRTLSVLDADGIEYRAVVYPHDAAAEIRAGEIVFERGPWDSLGRLSNPPRGA